MGNDQESGRPLLRPFPAPIVIVMRDQVTTTAPSRTMPRMWTRRVAQLTAVVVIVGTGGFLYYRYAPRRVPTGQPPLSYLSRSTLADLRATFNAASDRTRLLLLLSPT